MEFFDVCVTYVRSRALALEAMPESKQNTIKESNGDLRLEVIQILQQKWNSLHSEQLIFLPELVGSFLELMLVCSFLFGVKSF